MRIEKPSQLALFFKYVLQFMGQALFGHFLRGSTITITTPICQASTCGQLVAKGQTPSAPKQWKSDVHIKSYKPVSARLPLTKSKKKSYRGCSNIKSACVSALTGSVPRKMAEGQPKVSASCWNLSLAAVLTANHLKH